MLLQWAKAETLLSVQALSFRQSHFSILQTGLRTVKPCASIDAVAAAQRIERNSGVRQRLQGQGGTWIW
jgi:hypothetical protein